MYEGGTDKSDQGLVTEDQGSGGSMVEAPALPDCHCWSIIEQGTVS